MQKIKLDLDSLTVASFVTVDSDAATRGTVVRARPSRR